MRDEVTIQNAGYQSPYNRFFWGNLFALATATQTTTVSANAVTVANTITTTTTSIVSCIPSGEFVAGSTNACRRRRSAEILDEIFPAKPEM